MIIDWHLRFTQQAAWTRDLRTYLFEAAGLASANRVLEAGCGTGAILADLPSGPSIHGIDIDRLRLRQARVHTPSARLACADARALPYPDGFFDIVFCHFLLLWVPEPGRALAEMVRVTRPGGHVLALAEPDHGARVDQPQELAVLGDWQRQALRRQGADPRLGAHLADLFDRAGLEVVEAGTLQAALAAPDEDDWELEWQVLRSDLGDSVPARELERLRALDRQARRDGTRVLNVPTHFVWGRRG